MQGPIEGDSLRNPRRSKQEGKRRTRTAAATKHVAAFAQAFIQAKNESGSTTTVSIPPEQMPRSSREQEVCSHNVRTLLEREYDIRVSDVSFEPGANTMSVTLAIESVAAASI